MCPSPRGEGGRVLLPCRPTEARESWGAWLYGEGNSRDTSQRACASTGSEVSCRQGTSSTMASVAAVRTLQRAKDMLHACSVRRV